MRVLSLYRPSIAFLDGSQVNLQKMTCSRHPEYAGFRKPETVCFACYYIWQKKLEEVSPSRRIH